MAAGNEAVTVTQDFEVTAEELVRTLQRRGIPLPSEIGAFVVLEACEKLIGQPGPISAREIFITEQGDVECAERQHYDTESAAVTSLLSVLAELLVCAAPGVPNMLLDLVEHGPNDARLTLALLRSDLEACLLPLNRGATRRVLSRLVREVRKAGPSVPGPRPVAEVADVDATFDAVLRETAPPPRAARAQQALQAVKARAEQAAGELPRGIGSKQAGSELPRGVGSDRPSEAQPTQPTKPPRPPRDAAALAFGQPVGEEETVVHARAQRARARAQVRSNAAEPDVDGGERAQASAGDLRSRRADAARSADSDSDDERGPRAAKSRSRAGDGKYYDDAERPSHPAKSRSRAAQQDDAGDDERLPRTAASRSRAALGDDDAERRSRAPASRSRAPVDLDAMVEAPNARGRLGLWVFFGTTAAAVAMLIAYFALGREQAQSALGFLKTGDRPQVAPVKPPPVQRSYGDLRVNSQPDRAQVFLLIGPGPALATDIPLGVAQEFVAMAQEHRPARALLPADAVWDEVNGQPRYELAIQARPMHEGRRGRNPDALGPTLLPQNVGTPSGRLGSVRVVTTPRAAEVYQLIGFTPDVHVDNLPLDHAYELLVYVEGRGSARKRVEPGDFKDQNGKRVAQIDLQLPAAE